jgi:seryl-tRNA synthetase
MRTNRVGRTGTSPAAARRLDEIAQALLTPLGADGVYAGTALYEEVVQRLAAYVSRQREPGTEALRFPPVMTRSQVETSGYLTSFPHLLGCVSVLGGAEAEIAAAADRHAHGGDWTVALAATDLVLIPAACYPVYPLAASRGRVPARGLHFDVVADCFRREPSTAVDRLQSFRMREFVCIGGPDDVAAFRQRWMEHGHRMATALGLPHQIVKAADPFFGRTGQVLGIAQLQQSLKFELLVPLHSEEEPTACMSFNYHQDHFGTTWNLRLLGGAVAHTACAAFGMDRLTLAVFARHGLDLAQWPAEVRQVLEID